jgi:uncharacterized protein (TIGR03545 family)
VTSPLTPVADGGAAPDPTPRAEHPLRTKRTGVFRWRGVFPLLLLVALLVVAYAMFADRVARDTLSEVSTKALGTQVDVAALRILEAETAIEMDGIQVADPFDPMRNLLEVGGLRVELERDALLQKKAVIRRLTIRKVRAGTRRRVAATPAKGGGFAPQAMRAVQAWRRNFDIPKLKLAELDTVKSLVLDPRQLGTVKVAVALRDRADSTKDAIELELRALRLKETLDSTRATAERIAKLDPRAIGIVGARQVVVDVRRSLDTLRAVKARLETLQRDTKLGVASLREGVQGLDSARRADYAFARGLLKLPTFEAPEIGGAIFGQVTIDKFQQLLYYSKLAEGYVPPGLRPKQTPGPERLRMSGTTVRFAQVKSYPDFLLRRGDVDFALEGNALTSGSYTLAIANVTSQPALVGRPMEFVLSRRGGRSAARLDVRGASDRRATPRDVVKADLAALPLPAFALPGLPFRMDLNTGVSRLDFSRSGEAIRGRWTVNANQVKWQVDSARVARANYLEKLVYRVIGGLTAVDLEADIGGTMTKPTLAVRSTLDRAIAAQLKAVLGEEVAKAEAFARAKVDSIVRDKEAEARVKVEALRLQGEARIAEAQARLAEERAKLDAEREKLEERVKKATGGALGLPELPTIPGAKLPSIPKLPTRKGRTPPADTALKPDSANS